MNTPRRLGLTKLSTSAHIDIVTEEDVGVARSSPDLYAVSTMHSARFGSSGLAPEGPSLARGLPL